MNRTHLFNIAALLALATWQLDSAVFADDLPAHVLAQVDETSGFRTRNHRAIRIYDDGKVESLDKEEKWIEIARLSKAAVAQFNKVTDVMTTKTKLYTKDSGLADGPISTYLVKNKEGEVVLIGKKGPEDSIRLQGGASSIIEVLDGFKTLSTISY